MLLQSTSPSKFAHPQLAIVIPLKSKRVARNWDVTCQALRRTIGSLSNQSIDRFSAIVVGHEPPELPERRFWRFHSLEISIPELAAGGDYGRRNDFDRILDKNRKIARGVQLLSSKTPSHWFYLDADDVLDSAFVETVLKIESPGCIVDGGYQIDANNRRAIPNSNLSEICGSTCVLTSDVMEFPASLEPDEITRIPWCRYPHSRMDEFFSHELGRPFQRLRQPLVGYVTGHGDNCSDEFRSGISAKFKNWIKPRLLGRHQEQLLRERFGMECSD
ncbi:hypothetical protein Enr13x_31000 [Stieleria neptunia]|uniref:Glycosyl transferase family 2 n=1 Tax=Stieleria neptunia TaxID=2527979 RepID=A0A518HQX3_9BACT|nr:hypothetical protein Enr13x_31000 [Stieleria neptunia]